MNNKRRKQIETAIEKTQSAIELLEEAENILTETLGEIEEIESDEQDAYDNLPESFQMSEKGEDIEEAVSNMQDAEGYLNTDDLSELRETLEDTVLEGLRSILSDCTDAVDALEAAAE